ncbi:MAG: helix-turn-helix transcriptional regulator [Ruminococcaceae bacterium]|nr:helix-turn-helix transcriptional regulator [Oscillospiraceae bacterium]
MSKNLKFRVARISADLTQTQLAELAETSRQTINSIELGTANPSLNTCIALCRILGKTLDDLFWNEE